MTDESEKLNINVYVYPIIERSIEESAIKNELSKFLVRVAKPCAGVVPVNFNVADVVFGQKSGVTTQAGIVNAVKSLMK